jgi:hypothetical protein
MAYPIATTWQWSIPIKTQTFVFFKYGTFGLLIFTTIFCQYYPKLALSIYLNISISTWITPWNSLLDKLDICIFLLAYFMYYIQEIKYMFTVIIILSTTLYSRHVFVYLFTFVHVFACDRLKRSTRFQTLISKMNITRFVFFVFFLLLVFLKRTC